MSAPEELFDGLLQFDLGMNSGVAPVLLPKNQLAFAANATVRGTFVKPRPPWFDYQLDFGGDSAVQSAFLNGLWQGGCYALPDFGAPFIWGVTSANFVEPGIGMTVVIDFVSIAPGLTVGTIVSFGNGVATYEVTAINSPTQIVAKNLTGTVGGTFIAPVTMFTNTSTSGLLVVAISGHLYRVVPDPTTLTATVTDVTGGNSQHLTAPQHWLWQSEKWVIWNDGINLPVFYDLNSNTTRRSQGNNTIPGGLAATSTILQFTANPGSQVIPLASTYRVQVGAVLTFGAFGTMTVDSNTGTIVTATLGTIPPFTVIPFGTAVTFAYGATIGNELPAGKMGAYGKGRNWECLTDSRSFLASDIVGGPSGTPAEDFRDAVLHVTENNFLVGGGTFRVPLSGGQIRAMIFQSESDTSLGQGPLLIFTPDQVFSCQAPVDRLVWQTLTNPILTIGLRGAGALGQNSVCNFNGDVLFRSLLGVSSYILGRRDFDVWGNVPISREVERIIDRDAQNLLPYGSTVNFDNRLLMTCAPTTSALGVYHAGVVAINSDPLSNMQGKKPSCWDGLWPGLNAFQMMTGEFNLVNRCYAFVFEQASKTIALREVLPGKTQEIYDNATQPIQWTIESPVLFREIDPSKRTFKRLWNGEVFFDEMQGTINFEVQYKPDDYPCWIPWLSWQECAPMNVEGAMPQFRPQIGLGSPSGTPCDPTTNRPLREGFYFQVRLVVFGQCRFKGARFAAVELPEPKFQPPPCKPIC